MFVISLPNVAHIAVRLLLLAGLFEIGFAMGLKYSDGFTRLWPTVLTIGEEQFALPDAP